MHKTHKKYKKQYNRKKKENPLIIDLTEPCRNSQKWYLQILKQDQLIINRHTLLPMIPNSAHTKIITTHDAKSEIVKDVGPQFTKTYFEFHPWNITKEQMEIWRKIKKRKKLNPNNPKETPFIKHQIETLQSINTRIPVLYKNKIYFQVIFLYKAAKRIFNDLKLDPQLKKQKYNLMYWYILCLLENDNYYKSILYTKKMINHVQKKKGPTSRKQISRIHDLKRKTDEKLNTFKIRHDWNTGITYGCNFTCIGIRILRRKKNQTLRYSLKKQIKKKCYNKQCNKIKENGNFKCKQCKDIYCCSKSCMKIMWVIHKKYCLRNAK